MISESNNRHVDPGQKYLGPFVEPQGKEKQVSTLAQEFQGLDREPQVYDPPNPLEILTPSYPLEEQSKAALQTHYPLAAPSAQESPARHTSSCNDVGNYPTAYRFFYTVVVPVMLVSML